MLEFSQEEHDEMSAALDALALQVAARVPLYGDETGTVLVPLHPLAGYFRTRSPARNYCADTAAPAGVYAGPWGAVPHGAPGGSVGLAGLSSALPRCAGPGHAERSLRAVCT